MRLPDGTILTLRLASQADAAAVARMHRRCSLDTIFRRYLTAMPQLSPTLQLRLLDLRLTLVALSGEEVVGMAHLADAAGQPTELAVLVEDAWQRRGVGRALAEAVLDVAEAEGEIALTAYTLPSSVGVHTLLRRLRGGTLSPTFRHGSDGLVTVTLTLEPTGRRVAPRATRVRLLSA